jgi:hypothetical protein
MRFLARMELLSAYKAQLGKKSSKDEGLRSFYALEQQAPIPALDTRVLTASNEITSRRVTAGVCITGSPRGHVFRNMVGMSVAHDQRNRARDEPLADRWLSETTFSLVIGGWLMT